MLNGRRLTVGKIRSFAKLTFADANLFTGDVIYVHILNRKMIILNSFAAARDLMDKRSANYSDRPRLVLLNEV